MSRFRMERRRFLRGTLAGGATVALGLPVLDIMLNGHGDAYADGSPLQPRFGVIFYGTGLHKNWQPSDTGTLVLPEPFAPLERHRDNISMVSGLNIATYNDAGLNRHPMGEASVLTAHPPEGRKPAAPSMDQIVTDSIGVPPSALRSVHAGLRSVRPLGFRGKSAPLPTHENPRKLFNELFAGFAGSSDDEAMLAAPARVAYLDAVREDLSSLKRQLGASDQLRLDQYLQGVSELQRDVQAPNTTCADTNNLIDNAQTEFTDSEKHRLFGKLMATALACGRTQVFTYCLSGANSNTKWKGGLTTNHHNLGHRAHTVNGKPKQQHPELKNESVPALMGRIAGFLDAFAEIPEGGGTLLDNTGILILTEVSWSHDFANYPMIIAGRAGGALRGGVHVKASGPTSRGSLTVARAVGADIDSWGVQDARTKDSIDDLLA